MDALHYYDLILKEIGFPGMDEYRKKAKYLRKRLYCQKDKRKLERCGLFKRNAKQHPLAASLLKRLFSFDPDKRITALEALSHPYLA